MKRIAALLSLLALICLLIPASSAVAQVNPAPSLLNFQGRLAKPDGTPVADGTYAIRFSLWTAASGGVEKWNQTISAVNVRNGIFAVLLNVGGVSDLFNDNRWLEIKVGTSAPLTPRQQLVSVAYAMKANTVPDGSIGAAQIANGAITSGKLASGVIPGSLPPSGAAGGDLTGTYPNPLVASSVITAPKLAYDANSLSKVTANRGIITNSSYISDQQQTNAALDGTLNSWQSFTPGGSDYLKAILVYITSNNGSPLNATLNIYVGEGTGGTLLASQPVIFNAAYSRQYAVLETPILLTGGQKYTWQLQGSSIARIKYASGNPYPGGTCDYGANYDYFFVTYMSDYSDNDTISFFSNVGVGTSSPSAKLDVYSYLGQGINVFARTGSGISTYGYGSGNAGINAYGSGGAKAGLFSGDVTVLGSLSKASGSFLIDHPLDPANKTLSHSFVESPDMMNIYNGVIRLDRRGKATVILPAWFEALNRDFRYQLTCIGGYAPVYVAQEVKGNRFAIAGGKPGMKVSWQVTGIRHDAYANARRIKVEAEKTREARGTYLFPEGFEKRMASRSSHRPGGQP